MNEKTLDNFKKLNDTKQEEIISFLIKLLTYYPPNLFGLC